jgi:molybdopterin-guanine dinucleotide biosynthesis protein B
MGERMFTAVSIVGFKKSGKTTLVLDLAKELTARGRKVGAVKFTHHGLDANGTDTARFAEECVSVAGIGPREVSLRWNAARQLQDVLPLLGADIILVEGGKSLTWLPRIVALGTDEDESSLSSGLALASWGSGSLPGVRRAESIAELAALVEERGFALPGLDCGGCGRVSCHELAQEIVVGKVSPNACVALRPKLCIRVGGQQLSLNPFIDRLVTATLRGLLTELKGNIPGQRVEIFLD